MSRRNFIFSNTIFVIFSSVSTANNIMKIHEFMKYINLNIDYISSVIFLDILMKSSKIYTLLAVVAELAYALDSGSNSRK